MISKRTTRRRRRLTLSSRATHRRRYIRQRSSEESRLPPGRVELQILWVAGRLPARPDRRNLSLLERRKWRGSIHRSGRRLVVRTVWKTAQVAVLHRGGRGNPVLALFGRKRRGFRLHLTGTEIEPSLSNGTEASATSPAGDRATGPSDRGGHHAAGGQ